MRKKNRNTQLRIENIEILNYYRSRIISAALAQFEWHDMPDTCDNLYFEKSLLYNTQAAIYNLPENPETWLSTAFVQKGGFNVYGYPSDILGVGYNMANIPVDKFCVCYDNVMATTHNEYSGVMYCINVCAKLLYEVHNTFRSNLRQQNTPYIVKSDRNTLLTIRNFFDNVFGFNPVIETRPSFDTNNISTIDLRVDFKGREMLECLRTIWEYTMSMLGITEETTKKERMSTDEIWLNRMSDIVAMHNRLLPRLDFCNRFNKMTGMNISVNMVSEKYLNNEVFTFKPFERSETYENSERSNTERNDTERDNS